MQATDAHSAEHDEQAGIDARQDDAIDSLGARVAELEAALLAVKDEQLRERAELDNQRKRLTRDVEQARRFANERLLNELLPVIDNLERGLNASGGQDGLREGVELTLRQLQKVTEDNGLTAIDPTGQPFNPEHHQAMSMVDSAEHPSNTVVQAMQKGYLLNGRLLRPALVVVSN
ncbi:nucleotide exchange factor GrpE [Pseudomarimonas arenosa]|uniref:Protein GrpE n=1 Tax=Pseudomarimonas arenosa TaxID=2774145 RepID=A0AAW3ZJ88_9GAMM|nr:nucleotide exchange factor GrpE [Pseudomarimonas arenosa]MBD8524516.1 nucleotide exchange factor GrpE [Pseudomarimonas arenosa]